MSQASSTDLKKDSSGILVVVGTVKSAELVARGLRERGLRAEALHARLSAKKRQLVVEQLRNGELDAVVATTIGDEGMDIPNLRGVILLSGIALGRHRQRIGRASRPKTVNVAEVHDIAIMGTPLMRHAAQRYRRYRAWKWPILIIEQTPGLHRALLGYN